MKIKHILFIVLFTFSLIWFPALYAEEGFYPVEDQTLPEEVTETARKVSTAVVRIKLYRSEYKEKETPIGIASGTIISPDGYVLTAYHNIKHCLKSDNYEIVVERNKEISSDEKIIYRNATFIEEHSSAEHDVAILKINSEKPLPFVRIAFKKPSNTTRVTMVGHPKGVKKAYVSYGNLSEESYKHVYFDADARTGSSGSGVFFLDGTDPKLLLMIRTSIFGFAEDFHRIKQREELARWKRLAKIMEEHSEEITKIALEQCQQIPDFDPRKREHYNKLTTAIGETLFLYLYEYLENQDPNGGEAQLNNKGVFIGKVFDELNLLELFKTTPNLYDEYKEALKDKSGKVRQAAQEALEKIESQEE